MLSFPAPALGAEESCSDARWFSGRYYSTLEDMAGRRLYVYGIVDSLSELDGQSTDKDIVLNTAEPAGRLDTALCLYRLCGHAPENPCPFSDVPAEYADAVAWLAEAGVTKGVGNAQYGTWAITGHQFLVMLSRFFCWGTEDADELLALSASLGLPAVTDPSAPLLRGELFRFLSALVDLFFPDRRTPVRPEMSPPYDVEFLTESYEDALRQIGEALCFVPSCITVRFAEECPQAELDTFLSHFDWISDYNPTFLAADPEHGDLPPCFTVRGKDRQYKLWISHYAPAYEIRADALDWLRVFEDEAYAGAIGQFTEDHLLPLQALATDYEKALAAHDLLCQMASYDYTEYYDHTRKESHRLLGFIQNGQIVCDGYAYTYQWMLKYLGIDGYIVVGTAAGGNHAWNKVLLDGAWFNADVCWDDGDDAVYSDFYFLKSDAFFEGNQHQFTDRYSTSSYPSPCDYGR